MIDRSKPLTEQTAGDLRALIDALHGNRERYNRADRIVEERSCDLEIAEATRALAIINRRATEAEDQRSPAGIVQMDVDAALALLRLIDQPTVHALVTDMWTALQTMQPAQREAEYVARREAFLAGWLEGENSVYVGEGVREVSTPTGPASERAAEYARSKAGG